MKNTLNKSVAIIITGIYAFNCANQSQKKEEAQKTNHILTPEKGKLSHQLSKENNY